MQHIMSRNTKQTIVLGVFNSVLCYCLPLFGGCNNSEIDRLQIQQNKAARIVLNLPTRAHREYMFDKLGWMTVKQLISYHTLLTVFRIKISAVPEYLAGQLSRENKFGNIIVDKSNWSFTRRVLYQGDLYSGTDCQKI